MSEYLRSKRIIKAMEQPLLHNRQKKRLQQQKENTKPSDFIIKNEGVNEGVNKGVKDNFEGVKDTNIIDGISVIISAYKSVEFIEDCLDSVANQKTNFKYEVLLGIDGCEETLEKVKTIMYKYLDIDFHVYYSEENVGAYLMFNSLIVKSKYKYFTRFDSDDIMLDNFIEENVKYLLQYDCIIAKGIDFKNNLDINDGKNEDGIIILNKKDFLEINGYDEYRCGMDTDLLKRLKKENKKIYKCTINTYKRRIHSNSLTQNKETGYNSDYRNNIINIINNRINTKLESFKITTINEIHYINSYFDQIYCINLDRRIDRWKVLNDKFKKLGLNIKRISGVDGNLLSDDILKKYINRNKGEVGCMLTHYNIIEDAKKNNYKKILVLEDDVLFIEDFHNKFNEKIKNIPNDWKLLYLGATQHSVINEYHKDYYIPNGTDGTFAVAFDSSIYEEILLDKDIDFPIDGKLHRLQKKYSDNSFVLFPNLIITDVSDSDIREGRDNNEFRKKMKWDLENYDDKLYKAIISLTSWRARINNVHITIENLISTCPGFKIVLVLSEEEFPNKENELPNNLMKFVRDNSIEILWVYKNYKSFKKIVFTMDKYRDVPIISADDDCIYLYNYAQEFYDIWKDNRDFFISGWGKKNNDVWELGGAATLYPPFIFKNFGIDYINDDLLKLTSQDDVYYQCLRKIMNLNKVIVTNNHNNMYKYHNEIEPIRNEYKKMNNDDMNILRSKIENLIIPKENIVIGVILEKEDLQRKNRIFDSNDYNLIKPFVETAFKFSYKVKILHNNLSDKFIEKYSNNLLEFIKVTPNKEYNVYINKFQLIYEYLSNNPVNKVLITDITDVIFLNNGLFDYFQDNIIYSGIETKMLNDIWTENNSLTIRNSNNKFNNWWNLNKNKLKLLNCGLIGGNYDLIKDNLKELIDILNLYTKNNNEISEMFTWNFVAYNSGKKIISGEPFHTEYKAYDLENKNCYIAHK